MKHYMMTLIIVITLTTSATFGAHILPFHDEPIRAALEGADYGVLL